MDSHSAGASRTTRVRFLPIVLLVPLIQILAQPSWIFNPDGFDQWFYHGYFIDLKGHLAAFAGSYYGSRLAWILPGFLAYSLFPTLVANTLLRLFLCWTAAVSAYYMIRRTYGDRCALVLSLLLCSYPVFLTAAGWDYVDGAGIAYLLFCLEEGGAAAFASPGWASARAALCGMGFAAAVHSNFFLLVMAPVTLAYCLIRNGKKWLRFSIFATAGFFALTIALGLIDVALGGPFLFFLPSIAASRTLASAPNPSYAKLSLWAPHEWALVVPVAVLTASAVFLAHWISTTRFATWNGKNLVRVVDAGLLAFAFVIFIAMQGKGSPVLQLPYYADYLTPFMVATAAALIGYRLELLRPTLFIFLTGACIFVAMLVGTGFPRLLPSAAAAAYMSLRAKPVITAPWLSIILAAGLVLGMCVRKKLFAGAVIGACLSFVLIRLGDIELGESLGRNLRRESYLYTDRTFRELTHLSHDGPLWFWYSYSPGNEYYTSIASTYIWAARLLNRTLPDTQNLRFDALHRGTYIAIMNNDERLHQQAMAALAQNGLKLRTVRRLSSEVGDIHLLITLVKIQRRDRPPAVYTTSPPEDSLASSGELMDYDEATIETHTSRALYGKKTETPPTPAWIFRITDPRDHAATNFQPLAPSEKIAAIRVTVEDRRPEEPYGPLDLILQNQDYTVLYDSGAVEGKRSTIVALSPATHEIRIALLPNDDGFIRFPEHVTLQGLRRK